MDKTRVTKPHKSQYWINSHDEEFDAKAQRICNALEADAQDHLVICCDEKTDMQVLEHKAPTEPAVPGRREHCKHEYLHRGMRMPVNSLAVAPGKSPERLGPCARPRILLPILNAPTDTYPL